MCSLFYMTWELQGIEQKGPHSNTQPQDPRLYNTLINDHIFSMSSKTSEVQCPIFQHWFQSAHYMTNNSVTGNFINNCGLSMYCLLSHLIDFTFLITWQIVKICLLTFTLGRHCKGKPAFGKFCKISFISFCLLIGQINQKSLSNTQTLRSHSC